MTVGPCDTKTGRWRRQRRSESCIGLVIYAVEMVLGAFSSSSLLLGMGDVIRRTLWNRRVKAVPTIVRVRRRDGAPLSLNNECPFSLLKLAPQSPIDTISCVLLYVRYHGPAPHNGCLTRFTPKSLKGELKLSFDLSECSEVYSIFIGSRIWLSNPGLACLRWWT